MKKADVILYLIVALLCIFSFFLIIYTTPFGIGLSPDSLMYIGTSEGFLSGRGFEWNGYILNNFPPFYPFIISITKIFVGDSLTSARFLQAFLYASNIFLISIATYLSSNKNKITAILASLLFLTSTNILKIHNMAWSEPLFILLTLIAYLLFLKYFSSERFLYIILSAGVISLAIITRYAGLVFIPPAILILFFFDHKPFRKRFFNVLLYMTISLLPIALWFLRNKILAVNFANRVFTFHAITGVDIHILFRTVFNYWFPVKASYLIRIIVVLISIVMFLIIVFKEMINFIKGGKAFSISTLSLIFILFLAFSYMFFLTGVMLFFDAATVFDYRMLAPLHIFIVIAFLNLLSAIEKNRFSFIFKTASYVFTSVVLILNGDITESSIKRYRKDGQGYTSRKWRDSEIVEYANTLPEKTPIYSNGHDVIAFFAGRNAKILPTKYNNTSLLPNPGFKANMEKLYKEVTENGALILYFDKKNTRRNLPDKKDLENIYNMPVLLKLDDGKIYGISQNGKDAGLE